MSVDPRRLRPGDALAGLSGVAMIVFLFLPWYGDEPTGSGSGARGVLTGWQAFTAIDILLAIAAAMAIALAVLTLTQRAPALPVVFGVLTLVAGAVATIVVIVALIAQPGPNDMVGVRYGAYLGLVAALGILYGAFLSAHEEAPTWSEAPARRRMGQTDPPA